MSLSEKYIIENPENYNTSTYFYEKLYGLDASNNLDKLDPWEMGIECLLRADGRDRKIRENSKFSIRNLDVPMNVGQVSPKITELLKLLNSKQSYTMMKSPIEDFYKILFIPLDIAFERHYDFFHNSPLVASFTKIHQVFRSSGNFGGIYKQTNRLLDLNPILPYKPLTLNLFRDVINKQGILEKTKMKWVDMQQFDHTGSVMLNDQQMLNNNNTYWAIEKPSDDSMKNLKFGMEMHVDQKYSKMYNKDHNALTATYSKFQVVNPLFSSYMFLRHRRSGKIINHQRITTTYTTTRGRINDVPIAKGWSYVENNIYHNMINYCKSDFGNSVVTNANGHVDYASTCRSIFDMDVYAPSRWSDRKLAENETDHYSAMKALGFPMMFYNRNLYGLDGVTYKILRRWNINRLFEDYELLIPMNYKEEIYDSLTQHQQIYEPLEHRIRYSKPNELKSVVDTLRSYVLDFNNNPKVLKTDPKNLSDSVTCTVIDHDDANRAALKKLVDNMTTDDLLELWGGGGFFYLNPFKVRTGPVVNETIFTNWAVAPFYSPYVFRKTRHILLGSKPLIERYQLRLLAIPDVDFTKVSSTTNSINIKVNTSADVMTLVSNYFPLKHRGLSSQMSTLLYFSKPKDSNILDQLRSLGYPKNFLQLQETVIYSEDCQKILYAIDHRRYNRLTIFTNEKIFLNSDNYKMKLYSRATINPHDFFRIVTTNTSSIHLHFYRYDSSSIKQVFEASVKDKTPHPMKNVILSIHEPRIQKPDHTRMTDFRFNKKITYIISPKTASDDLQTDFTSSISDEVLQADLKALQDGSNKGDLYIQLTNIMVPTSFKDKKIKRLFILSDLAENTRFYIDNSLEPVLASINVTENAFLQRHMGRNGSAALSLLENDNINIAPIIPIDQIYKLNSFFVKIIDEKSRVVEFTNDKFPIDLTLALYYKKRNLKRQHVR